MAALDGAVHEALPLHAGVLPGKDDSPGWTPQPRAQARVEVGAEHCIATARQWIVFPARVPTARSGDGRPSQRRWFTIPSGPSPASSSRHSADPRPPASSISIPLLPRWCSLASQTAPIGSDVPKPRGRPRLRQNGRSNCSNTRVAGPYRRDARRSAAPPAIAA